MTRQARRGCLRGDASPRFHLRRAIAHSVERGWPLVMAVLNVTPDSFSDGGQFAEPARAIEHALRCVEHGADIVDVGGESTRPGSIAPSIDEEMARVIPVIEAVRHAADVAISVDTSKPEIMRAAAAAGADLINDVRALGNDDALQTAAQLQLPVVLMHMAGEPQTMQDNPQYDNVVSQVRAFLVDRANRCRRAGIDASQIVLDPGFGFGKTVQHNLSLLKHLRQLVDTGYPVLVGLSRKSMIRTLLGREVDERMPASVSLAIEASVRGVSIVRVHDVLPTVDALKIRAAVEHAS